MCSCICRNLLGCLLGCSCCGSCAYKAKTVKASMIGLLKSLVGAIITLDSWMSGRHLRDTLNRICSTYMHYPDVMVRTSWRGICRQSEPVRLPSCLHLWTALMVHRSIFII